MNREIEAVKTALATVDEIRETEEALRESVAWFRSQGFEPEEIADLTELPTAIVRSVVADLRISRVTRLIFFYDGVAAALLLLLFPLYFATVSALGELAVVSTGP